MDSIYGGRPGAPFVIKSVFQSIKDMQEKFKKGAEFKDVWFNEYCIIDTPNKNDWDNGKIYQRGPEWFNDDGDAKYIGQIVGPQSGVPSFELGTLEDVRNYTDLKNGKHVEPYPEVEQGKPGYETRTWIYDTKNDEGKSIEKLFLDRQETCDGKKHEPVKTKQFDVGTNSLVKGMYIDKDGKRQFNDAIQYNWVNIAYPFGTVESGEEDNPDLFANAKTLVGFRIPYTVEEYNLKTKLPYSDAADEYGRHEYDDSSSMEEDESTRGRPFGYLWNLKIPMGIKGDSFQNFRKVTYEEIDKNNLYFMDEISSTVEGDRYKVTVTAKEENARSYPTGWKDEIGLFWVCDFCHYAGFKEGTKYTILLGSAEELDDVDYDYGSGILTIKFTNQKAKERNIPAVNKFTFDDSTGKWSVGFNNAAIGLTAESFSDNTETIVTPSTAEGQIDLIKDTSYDSANGKFTVTHTKDRNTKSHDLPSVNEFTFDDSTGKWSVGFNNAAINLLKNKNSFSSDATVTEKRAEGKIKFLNSVNKVDFGSTDSADDGTKIIFSDTAGAEKNQVVLNTIFDLYSDLGPDKSNHLYALYTSKAARGNDDNDVAGFKKGFKSTRITNGVDTAQLNWKDLGSIKDQSGVLIGHDLSNDALTDTAKTSSDEMLKWLNENRKLTYDGTSYADESGKGYNDGKLLTYVDTDGTTWFFAWDYSQEPKKGDCAYWYFVGKSTSNSGNKVFFSDIKGSRGDSGAISLKYPAPEGSNPGDLVFLQARFKDIGNNHWDHYGNWWEAPITQ